MFYICQECDRQYHYYSAYNKPGTVDRFFCPFCRSDLREVPKKEIAGLIDIDIFNDFHLMDRELS